MTCAARTVPRSLFVAAAQRLLHTSTPTCARRLVLRQKAATVTKEQMRDHINRVNDIPDFYENTIRSENDAAEQTADGKSSKKRSNIGTAADTVDADWYVDSEAFSNKPAASDDNGGDQYAFSSKIPKWMQVKTRTGISTKPSEYATKSALNDDSRKAFRSYLSMENMPAVDEDLPPSVDEVVYLLRLMKGANITVIDMRKKCDFTNYLVIVEGSTTRQVYYLIEAVKKHTKERNFVKRTEMPGIVGLASEDWLVYNTGRVMVHAFTPEARNRYDLESLWTMIEDPLK